MSQVTITWTPEMRDRFRAAYLRANAKALDRFEFDGNQFLVSYARYLLEFLDQKFA